jgi:glycosyltransferase involved in cell wall biosynthesis
MKVLLLSGEFPPLQGGMGDYSKELGQGLASLGVEVHVITSIQGDSAPKGLVVHPLIRHWGWRCWGPIARLMKQECPQVLHIQYQTAAYGMHPAVNCLPWRLRLMPDRPHLVVTFHDLRVPYLFPKAGWVRQWVTQLIARGCDALVATNQEDELALRQDGFGAKVTCIPIGSNITPHLPPEYDRDTWRMRWGVGSDTMLLGHFGFLNASKGIETLLRALKLLVEDGHDMHLLMVGGKVGSSDPTNRAYAQAMEALIGDLGLSERIHWTDFVPQFEVSANLMASDLCVLPYRDGISFRRGSLLACLAHGCPIVSTRPSGRIPELQEGRNVLLAPPDDPATLARRVEDAVGDARLRQQLSEGARHLAQRFTWPAIARQTVALYEGLLQRTGTVRE